MSMLQRAKAVADAARRTPSSWLDALRSSPVVTDLPPAWVFLGPPGVGKGTYASRMASKLGVPHIAAGDLVRAQIRDRTPQGLKVCFSTRSRSSWTWKVLNEMLQLHPN